MLGPLRFTSRKKNVKVIMELEVPEKAYLHAYIIYCYGPMGFAVGEAK
jgi:hypothetical protein